VTDPAPPIFWPERPHFAFNIFDNPNGQTLETSRLVYGFLADLGFRTTIAVWPLGARREPNSGGETCANPLYADHLRSLAARGFEIAWHGATLHTSLRPETLEGLEPVPRSVWRRSHVHGESLQRRSHLLGAGARHRIPALGLLGSHQVREGE
jgi:hypothetical protein